MTRRTGFPPDTVAIALNGGGDKLILLPGKDKESDRSGGFTRHDLASISARGAS